MATKKAARKHDPQKAGKDARRAFEHLGRIQAITSLAATEQESIKLLVAAADGAFRDRHYKDAAELLRAAEHLSFACMIEMETDARQMSREMVSAIQEEYDHLRQRAEEHGGADEAPIAIRTIYARMVKDADVALKQDAYRRALELARAVEALAHVDHFGEKLLEGSEPHHSLQGFR